MSEKGYESKRKRISKVGLILIVIIQVILASLVSLLLVFNGLFPVVQKMLVGTAMSSYKHQYIAKDHNAIAAINAGGFMDKSANGSLWTGTGAYPTGFIFSRGKIVYQDISDDKPVDVIAIDSQGKMIIGSHSINDLKNLKVSEAIRNI
jgi:exopolysaccharide biosynthesis protein